MTTNGHPIIYWFKQDLRLSDNPALFSAIQKNVPLILLYMEDDTLPTWPRGAASCWWLHQSLKNLEMALNTKYSATLNIEKGAPLDILLDIIQKHQVQAVYWNECYEPSIRQRDQNIKALLEKQQIQVTTFNGALLHDPWKYQTLSGGDFKVFTPFWKKLQTMPMREIIPTLPTFISMKLGSHFTIDTVYPAPKIPWDKKIAAHWIPGENTAKDKLAHFLKHLVKGYKIERNYPAHDQTSKLSPHLHFGEISPIQIWHAALHKKNENPSLAEDIDHFLSELAWREFSYHLLYYFPSLAESAFKPKFNDFPWHDNDHYLTQWQKGKTGYPIVDAGMRELWETGWMHNRVRMLVASFLVKDLLLPWQSGERWFWDTLVDADLANNAASWQWVAGSGADAAPYFRIFNPILQGQKFDPDGEYVRKWVPELKELPTKYIHAPWEAPPEILKMAHVTLGKSYPNPIVDHAKARDFALSAYQKIK